MRLTTTLTATMIGLVVTTAAAAGALAYRGLWSVVVPLQLEALESDARFLAADLVASTQAMDRDLRAMRGLASIAQLAAAAPGSAEAADARARLGRVFLAQLEAKPSLLQLRVIGPGGREVVRVERPSGGGPPRVVPDPELQDKGDRPYVIATMALPGGALHVSDIELNREHGAVEEPGVPVLRWATPIDAADGTRWGVLLLNVDMRPAFARVRDSALAAGRLYVVNARGDFLVHPDPEREFGFERGRPARIQEELPGLEPITSGDGSVSRLMEHAEGAAEATGVAAVPAVVPEGPRLTVVQAVPTSLLLAPLSAVKRAAAVAALLVAGVAVIIAAGLARSLTRPITRITAEIERWPEHDPTAMPTEARNEVGTLARAFAELASDVRAKTRALEAQLEITRLHSIIVESSNDEIVTMDLSGTITGWNRAAAKRYGYTREEAVGRPIDLLVPEGRREEVEDLLARVARGESVEPFETTRVARDGRTVRVSIGASPVSTEDGRVVGVAKIGRDVTQQREMEEKFRLAVEACPSGMVMVDADGTIVLANAEAERLFGYERGELLGRWVDSLVPEQHRAAHVLQRRAFVEAPVARMMGSGRDLAAARKDGTEFPVEIGLNPLSTAAGPAVLAVVIDITERKRAAEAIERHQKELERSNADLEQFAYVASHDLQEPLRMVASYAELLGKRYAGKLDERADRYIGYAVEGARRMQQLVRDLLTYSRVGTQGLPLRVVNPASVVQRTLRELHAAVSGAEARVEVGDLHETLVLADAVQLGQVFQNLIGNAVKFRTKDRPPIVRVGAERRGDMVEFEVADNGVGIDPRYHERVFEMFQRLHDRSEYEGSGIGLTIAKKIVERHGGEIRFDSVPGGGTTFRFTIPSAPAWGGA